MGDIVLLEDEVSPAMSAALDNGLAVTALHNHFFFESPRVMYMHIGGSGDPAKLATAVKKVIDASAPCELLLPTLLAPSQARLYPQRTRSALGPSTRFLEPRVR